jgi:hypothetical protein
MKNLKESILLISLYTTPKDWKKFNKEAARRLMDYAILGSRPWDSENLGKKRGGGIV